MPPLPPFTRKQPIGEAELTGRCSASHANASRVGGKGPSVMVIDRRQGRPNVCRCNGDARRDSHGRRGRRAGRQMDRAETRPRCDIIQVSAWSRLSWEVYLFPYIPTYTYIRTNLYMHTYIYISTDTYIHTCKHKHIYIPTQNHWLKGRNGWREGG